MSKVNKKVQENFPALSSLFFRQIRDVVEEGIAVDVVDKVDWAAIFCFDGTATARSGNNHVTIHNRTFHKVFFPE